MSEKIDLELTGIYNAMDEGLIILAEEKRKMEDQNLSYEKQLKTLKKESFAFLPEILRPFSKLLDMDTYIDEKGCFKSEFIWWLVEIPDLAMIGVFWNSTSENNLKYAVFKPEFTGNPGNPFEHADEWKKIIAYRDITDHKIALARAYQVMENYVQRQHDCILSKFKIEKVIEDNYGWKLEKHNKFLIALKDNSLIVDPEKHIYYWNSKGENGNVIDFVMQREGLSYKDAVGHLSEIYNSCNEVIEPENVPLQDELNERIAAIDGAKVKNNLLKIPLDILYGFLKSIRIEDVITESGWNLKPNSEDDPNYLVDEGMHVNVKLQTFHWGQKTGGVLDWIMQTESMDWAEAVGELIDRYWGKFGKNVEPEYVPFEQDLIDSNGQFDTPLAQVWSSYVLNELVNLINNQIDERLVNIKK